MLRDANYVSPVAAASYPVREGCAVRPLVDGEPAFRRICEAVEAARKSVWVTVAFLEREAQLPDGRGSFFDVLDRATARGVEVRALFWRCPELEAVDPGKHFSGTEAECAWLLARSSRFLARWDRAHALYCQHQKSWLIDAGERSEVGFVGGINLTPSSISPPGHANAGVHDVYVELRGPCVTDVQHNFVQRWNEASERLERAGQWPEPAPQDLEFPRALSPAAGDVPVQIQRTVHAGLYRDATASPQAERYEIAQGEFSILEQYVRAIENARSSIYCEDQAIASLEIVTVLDAALARGVEVVFLVPGEPPASFVAALKTSGFEPLGRALAALGAHPNFALVGLAVSEPPGTHRDVYVHAKIAIVDDAFCTIGSCNVANRSFRGDTELNASFWHSPTSRALRCELLEEHLGRDTSQLDDRAALRLYAEIARANALRRARGVPMEGLAFAIDPATYGR